MTPDLLDLVQVTVPCNVCDETYTVPASVVRTSQELLAQGCSGTSSYECDASYYATLIDHDAIESLEHVWADFCRSATSHGGTGVKVDAAAEHGRRADLDRRALHNWENEGGRNPAEVLETASSHHDGVGAVGGQTLPASRSVWSRRWKYKNPA